MGIRTVLGVGIRRSNRFLGTRNDMGPGLGAIRSGCIIPLRHNQTLMEDKTAKAKTLASVLCSALPSAAAFSLPAL